MLERKSKLHINFYFANFLSFLLFYMDLSINAINNGSACSVLFLRKTGLFPAGRKILEHDTQSSALMFF